MSIDYSQMVTAEARAAADLASAREAALITLVAWLEERARQITGAVPETERLSWTTKEAAARALLAGTATPAQSAMLELEAALIGRTSAQLADRITAKADAWQMIAAVFAATRQIAEKGIVAATTPNGTVEALTAAQTACEAELEELTR